MKEVHSKQASTLATRQVESTTKASEYLLDLTEKFEKLIGKKGQATSLKEKIEFNEHAFALLKEAYKAKRTYYGSKDLQHINQLENELVANSNILDIATIINHFGREKLKDSYEATIASICTEFPEETFTTTAKLTTLKKDCSLMRCDKTEMQSIYLKRMLRAEQLKISSSLVHAIENTWMEMQFKGQKESEERLIDNHKVIFIPHGDKKGIYIKQKELGKGTYKVATAVLSFFEVQKNAAFGKLVVLEERPIMEEGVKEEGTPRLEEGTPRLEEGTPRLEASPEVVDQDEEFEDSEAVRILSKYEEEAAMYLKLKDIEGIWPTHSVTNLGGGTAIFQKRAGISMTLRDGGKEMCVDLHQMCRFFKKGKLDFDAQLAYLKMTSDFLLGAKNLHEKGYIHRDLKPLNVLCSPEGGGVTDFGTICSDKLFSYEKEEIPDPSKRRNCGTPNYMAPEIHLWTDASHQKSGDWAKIGTPADIWSIGISLWQLFTDKAQSEHPAHVVTHGSLNGVGNLLDEDNPQLLEKYKKDFPEPADKDGILHMIWECTRVNPDERITIDKLVTKFNSWANGMTEKLRDGEALVPNHITPSPA